MFSVFWIIRLWSECNDDRRLQSNIMQHSKLPV